MRTLPVSFYNESVVHVPLKVSLFTRIHEMQRLTEQLKTISMLEVIEKKLWLKENETFLRAMLDSFSNHSYVHLPEEDVDPQLVNLLMEYTQELQNLMNVVPVVFDFDHVQSLPKLPKVKKWIEK